MAGNNGDLRPEKISTEYIPELLAEIKSRLDSAFGRFEKDIIGDQVNRVDYVLIDGHPLNKYIADHLVGDEYMPLEQKIEKAPAMILNALIQGKKISWCIPDARTGSFKAEQLQSFAAPANLNSYLDNAEIKAGMLADLEEKAIPADNEVSSEQIEADEAESAQLLELRSKYNLDTQNLSSECFLRQDFLRDIKNENPDKSLQELLDDLNDPKDFKFTMGREAFVNHAVAMLVLEGADPEVIYDPERGADLRADAGRRLYKMCKDKDIDGILNINLAFAQKAQTIIENELKVLDFTDEKVISSPRALAIAQLSKCSFDLLQERDRYKERSQELLAVQMGDEIKTPQDRQKYADEYKKFSDKTNALGNLTLMAACRRKTAESGLGFTNLEYYRNNILPRIVESQFVQSLISEAQRNGKSVAEALNDKTVQKISAIDYGFESGTARGKEAYDKLANNITGESMNANAKALFDGSFRANNRFSIEYRMDGEEEIPVPVFEEGNDGLSRHTDHAKADREFYSADFIIPTDDEIPHPESVASTINNSAFAALKNKFNIIINKSGQDRLYTIDENNQLVSLEGRDFLSPEGRVEMRRMAYQGKLFAVSENENAPVQLQFNLMEDNHWDCTAADCLDNDPKPVPYKWYHALGRFFGIASCIAQKAAHDKSLKRTALVPSIRQIAESRKSLTGFAEVSKKNLAKEQAQIDKDLIDIERNSVSSPTAIKSIAEIYGTKPLFREKFVGKTIYTKEQFDTLKQYELGLKDGPEIGFVPGVDAGGRIEFRESDFIALSMAAALTPELGGVSRKGGADSELMDPNIVVDANHTMYINDLAMNFDQDDHILAPRENVGRYIQNTIAPARDIAANAIEQYRAGNNKPLAALIANGIAFAARNAAGAKSDPSAAVRAVTKFMAVYGNMLKADSQLNEAVRAKVEENKALAAEARRQNQAARDAFRAEHGEYINAVTNEMLARKTAINGFKSSQNGAREAAIRDQNKYFEEHPDFLELVQKNAMYDAVDKFYEMNESLDVDKTLNAMDLRLRTVEALEKGSDALAEIKRADIEHRSLTPEQNVKLMKDIIRAELIKTHDNQVYLAQMTKGQDISKSVDSIIKLDPAKLLPEADMTNPEKVIKNQSKSIEINSLKAGCITVYESAETRNGSSPVTKALTDPVKGDAELDKIFNAAFPNGASFSKMQPKYLLQHANNVPKVIAQYQKDVIAQKQAELRQAASKASEKNLEANAADKVIEVPNQGALQMNGMN